MRQGDCVKVGGKQGARGIRKLSMVELKVSMVNYEFNNYEYRQIYEGVTILGCWFFTTFDRKPNPKISCFVIQNISPITSLDNIDNTL